MKKIGKYVVGSAIVVVAIILVTVQLLEGITVEVEEMQPRHILRSFTEEGFMKAPVEHTVFSMYRARITSLPVKEGERVEKGDLLVKFDDRELQYMVANLEAERKEVEGEALKLTEEPDEANIEEHLLAIEQAEERFRASKREYQRKKNLFEEGAISEEKYKEVRDKYVDRKYDRDRAKKALQVLYESYDPPPGSWEIIDARRSSVAARLQRLLYQVDEYSIFSPVTGYVGRLEPEEKEVADPAAPLMTIFSEEDLRIEVPVLDRDVIELSPGMMVEVRMDLKNEEITFPGEIIRIAHHAEKDISPLGLEERRVEVIIQPTIPEELTLGPGYEVDVTFETAREDNRLVVPQRAVFTYDGEDAVYVVENGRAGVRTVTTGFETQREVVILEGVEAGEQVILNPRIEGLREGVRVEVE